LKLVKGMTVFNYGDIWQAAEVYTSAGSSDIAADTLTLNDGSKLTLDSGGAITVTHAFHTVDTLGDSSSDNLDTVNGLATNEVCYIRANHTDRTVVIRDGQGNISTSTGESIYLDDDVKMVKFMGTASGVYAYPENQISFDLISSFTELTTLDGTERFPAGKAGSPSEMKYVTYSNLLTQIIDDTIGVADGLFFFDPTIPTWTALNQGGGSYSEDTTNKRLTISEDGDGSLDIRGWHTPIPAGGAPYTVTLYIQSVVPLIAALGFLVGWRQSSDGKIAALRAIYNGTLTAMDIRSDKFNSATALSANYTNSPVDKLPRWIRLADNGTNRIISYSPDGIVFSTLHTVGRTDFLTGDQIVFAFTGAAASSIANTTLSLLSYEVG
jgi:hypothetical protein